MTAITPESTEDSVHESPEARYALMRALMARPVYSWLFEEAERFAATLVEDINMHGAILDGLKDRSIYYIVKENVSPAAARLIRARLNSQGVLLNNGVIVALQIQAGATAEMLQAWDQEHNVVEQVYAYHVGYPQQQIYESFEKIRITRESAIDIKDHSLGFLPKMQE